MNINTVKASITESSRFGPKDLDGNICPEGLKIV